VEKREPKPNATRLLAATDEEEKGRQASFSRPGKERIRPIAGRQDTEIRADLSGLPWGIARERFRSRKTLGAADTPGCWVAGGYRERPPPGSVAGWTKPRKDLARVVHSPSPRIAQVLWTHALD